MRRMIFLSIAILTFLFGCLLAWLPFGPAGVTPQPSEAEAPHVEARAERKGLLDGIKPTGRGCGNGYVQGYELPDGRGLGEGNDCHSSFGEAKKEMRTWLGKAEQVIETVKPAGRGMGQKSERVVASFPRDEAGNEWVEIMWVHGRCIHWISAPDLEHALAFEKSELDPYRFEE